jgi:hypothetical protein
MIVLTVATALASLPARADDFCDGLKQVIADARGGFPNTRGAADYEGGHLYGAPAVVLPGTTCHVETGGGANYTCFFPPSDQLQSDLVALRDRVTACVGVQPEPAGANEFNYTVAGVWRRVSLHYADDGSALEIDVNTSSDGN